jgi:hypothetical protein
MQRAVEVILSNWREVERRLAETEAGTPESESLEAEASRLRDEYHRHLDALRESQPPGSETPTATAGWPWGESGRSG